MGIIIAGTEPSAIGSPMSVVSTLAGTFDPAFSRCSIRIVGGQPGAVSINLPATFGANSASGFWLHFRLRTSAALDVSFSNNNWLKVMDDQGRTCISLRSWDWQKIDARLWKWDGSTYTATAEWSTFPANSTQVWDIHVYTLGGASYAVFYINGAVYWTLTRASDANVGFKTLLIGSPFTADNANTQWYMSELILSTTDTRGLRVRTLPPLADGAHTDFSGTYVNIADAAPTVDAVYSNTVGHKYTYQVDTVANLPIAAVVVNALAGSDGVKDLRALARIGGVDYASSDLGLSSGIVPVNAVFELDPSTGLPWTGVNAEFGFEVVA